VNEAVADGRGRKPVWNAARV